MLKTLLVPLVGLQSDSVALETAFALARIFDSHIDGLHVQPDTIALAARASGYDMTGTTAGYLSPDVIDALQEGVALTAKDARSAFDSFCQSSNIPLSDQPGSGRSAHFQTLVGNLIPEVTAFARVHDLAVFGRAAEYSGLGVEGTGAVLVRSGKPVLLAPQEAPKSLGKHVAVAWKETAEACRAVTAAMPLLHKADMITILAAAEGDNTLEGARKSAERLAEELRWHGLSPAVHTIAPGQDSAHDVVGSAQQFGVDLLVMGGYGHSRAREFVLGGFTRHVLHTASLPIFMTH